MKIRQYWMGITCATAALAWIIGGYAWNSSSNQIKEQAVQAATVEEKVQLESMSRGARGVSNICLVGGGTFFLASFINVYSRRRQNRRLEEKLKKKNKDGE